MNCVMNLTLIVTNNNPTPLIIAGQNLFSSLVNQGQERRTRYSTVNELVTTNTKILVAAPTGFLATVYRYLVDDEVTCDTVHTAFHIPVQSDQSPSINWDISRYDLFIIDEVSMISEGILTIF